MCNFFLVGFDPKNEVISVVGSLDQPSSFTSQADIGRAIARLSVLASFPESYPGLNVPETVVIAGSTYTHRQIAEIFTAERKKHSGFTKGDGYQTEEIDLKTYKEELKESVLKGEEKGLLKTGIRQRRKTSTRGIQDQTGIRSKNKTKDARRNAQDLLLNTRA